MKLVALSLVALSALAQSPAALKAKVAAMLKADQDNPPTSEGVMFVGGGPVEGWDLRHYFGAWRTANRGIPDAHISDFTTYADQLIVPFKPSTIVVCLTDGDTIDGFAKFSSAGQANYQSAGVAQSAVGQSAGRPLSHQAQVACARGRGAAQAR